MSEHTPLSLLAELLSASASILEVRSMEEDIAARLRLRAVIEKVESHADLRDITVVCCLECGWRGLGYELRAQSCPICDGRCADAGSKEYEAITT